jgi:transposase-like protein
MSAAGHGAAPRLCCPENVLHGGLSGGGPPRPSHGSPGKGHDDAEAQSVDCVRIVHFLRNALDHLPRKADDDCLQELRWIYDRRELVEARADLAAWLKKWGPRYENLTSWVEEHIEETLSYYRLPRQHHKHLKSTNMLERLNEEIKRRTRVVRIFPNGESCLRLVRALAVETHENWLEANRYLNMDDLREQKKLLLREAA